jgi:hypothetical protein
MLGGTARIALGSTNERVEINGSTTVTVPGFAPVTNPGGLLALSSNSGSHTRDVFAVIPEARVQLAYHIGPHLRRSCRVQLPVLQRGGPGWRPDRPGGQPRPVASPLAGAFPQRPAFRFEGSSVWAQGIDLGMELRF